MSFDVSQLALSLYKYWWPTTISEKCSCYVFVLQYFLSFILLVVVKSVLLLAKIRLFTTMFFTVLNFYGFFCLVSFLCFFFFISYLASQVSSSHNTTQICLQLTNNGSQTRGRSVIRVVLSIFGTLLTVTMPKFPLHFCMEFQ